MFGTITSRLLPLALMLTLASHAENTATIDSIPNYRSYTSNFASAGQPTAEQLAQLQASGVQRVIYIAFSDHKGSLAGEDRTVRDLGMDYLHIPVVWNAPSASDFALFAAAMNQAPQKKTLLHCQVNFRASAFAMLYRVIYQNVPVAVAKGDMNSVWTPDATRTSFIRATLKAHGIDSDCNGCDWTPAEL